MLSSRGVASSEGGCAPCSFPRRWRSHDQLPASRGGHPRSGTISAVFSASRETSGGSFAFHPLQASEGAGTARLHSKPMLTEEGVLGEVLDLSADGLKLAIDALHDLAVGQSCCVLPPMPWRAGRWRCCCSWGQTPPSGDFRLLARQDVFRSARPRSKILAEKWTMLKRNPTIRG
jgi:hypothetical protein